MHAEQVCVGIWCTLLLGSMKVVVIIACWRHACWLHLLACNDVVWQLLIAVMHQWRASQQQAGIADILQDHVSIAVAPADL